MQSSAAAPRLAPGNFYGEMLMQHDAGGFNLSETRYLPYSRLPHHSHESHYICFVLRGTYQETYDRKTRTCQPAMVLYHPAGELHAQSFAKSAVALFRVEVNPKRFRYPDLRIGSRDFRHGICVELAYKLYSEFRQPDVASYMAIEGLGLELIATIARASACVEKLSPQPPRWLRQARELVQSRFLEQLKLTDIAATAGVHPVTLAREFRYHYDCTIGELLRRERIDFACRELLKPEASILNVAVAAGFYDQSHFSKTFKRLIGMTPSDYRRSFSSH